MRHEKAMWPIIYVRGYAMTEGEIEATSADPFCGFNLGSTVYRATPDKNAPPRKFIFESPVVRLGSDYGYSCIFDAGADLFDPDWTKTCIPPRSTIIYRYYDEASRLLGTGETPPIETFAEGVGTLILRVRDLVCRAFLQNPKLGDAEAKRCVDKVFTYATPHNGIDMAGINVPRWLTANDISNFSRSRMAEYLNLKKHGKERVDWLPEEAFPSERFFCMVGTNRSDYDAGFGLSRTFAGHGSDGLVRVPDYEVEGKFWSAEHYEGGYLFRDTVIVELTPPQSDSGAWKVSHAWESTLGVEKSVPLALKSLDDGIEIAIDFDAPGSPGITGRLRLIARAWNN